MKWNWGKGIVLAFSLFCGFVVTIVVLAFQEDFDLVSDTYYRDELNFQHQIDSKSNLAQSQSEVLLEQGDKALTLHFPVVFEGAEGIVHFYHPSRAIFDRKYEINLDSDNRQVIVKTDLVKGRYKVRMTWTVAAISYYQESEIFLQ